MTVIILHRTTPLSLLVCNEYESINGTLDTHEGIWNDFNTVLFFIFLKYDQRVSR